MKSIVIYSAGKKVELTKGSAGKWTVPGIGTMNTRNIGFFIWEQRKESKR